MNNKYIIVYVLIQLIFINNASCMYGDQIQATQISLLVESNKTLVEKGECISICYIISNLCDYTAKRIDVYTTIPYFLYYPSVENIMHECPEDYVAKFGHGFQFHIKELKAHQSKSFCYATYIVNSVGSNGKKKCALSTNVTVLRSGIYMPKIFINDIYIKNSPCQVLKQSINWNKIPLGLR